MAHDPLIVQTLSDRETIVVRFTSGQQVVLTVRAYEPIGEQATVSVSLGYPNEHVIVLREQPDSES